MPGVNFNSSTGWSFLTPRDQQLKMTGRISDLGWLNLLLRNPYELAISGAGEVGAEVVVSSGWLGEGTSLVASPRGLMVDVLDYQAKGDGGVEIEVTKGGEHPDLVMDVAVADAQFGRRGEEQTFIEEVEMTLQVSPLRPK